MHWDIGSVQDSVANELPHILFIQKLTNSTLGKICTIFSMFMKIKEHKKNLITGCAMNFIITNYF